MTGCHFRVSLRVEADNYFAKQRHFAGVVCPLRLRAETVMEKVLMKARVFVTLKNGVLDPQGKAIGHALNNLGFGSVGDVRQGKLIEIELSETDADKAKAELKDMCEKLLANTVIEKYDIELKP